MSPSLDGCLGLSLQAWGKRSVSVAIQAIANVHGQVHSVDGEHDLCAAFVLAEPCPEMTYDVDGISVVSFHFQLLLHPCARAKDNRPRIQR